MTETGSRSQNGIAILGWGSLLWDKCYPEFEQHHGPWELDGPLLNLEFSRVSSSRDNALTLVIDPHHGSACRVAYAMSERRNSQDAIADLCSREKTTSDNIGCYFADESAHRAKDARSLGTISQWAQTRLLDVVIWTDLGPSFEDVPNADFVCAAIRHIQQLPPTGKAKAAEYVWRSPTFVDTPLRRALQVAPWFPQPD
jgi:hypothetical protein